MMPARHAPAVAFAAGRLAARQRECRSDFLQQVLAVERLGQVAEHAALRRADGVGNRAVRGQDDDRQRRVLAMNRLEQLQAVDAGHSQVGDDRRGPRDRDGASAVSPLSAVRTR